MLALKTIIEEIIKPESENINICKKQAWKIFLQCFLYQLFFLFLSAILFSIFHFLLEDIWMEKIQYRIDFDSLFQQKRYSSILIISIIAPFLEEIIFRLPLVLRQTYVKYALFSSIIYFFSLIWAKSDLVYFLYAGIIILIFSSLLIVRENIIEKLNTRYRKQIVWGSVLLFSVIHFGNFEPLTIQTLPLICIRQIPVLSFAVFATYLRLKSGVMYAILFHFFVNSFPWLFYVFQI